MSESLADRIIAIQELLVDIEYRGKIVPVCSQLSDISEKVRALESKCRELEAENTSVISQCDNLAADANDLRMENQRLKDMYMALNTAVNKVLDKILDKMIDDMFDKMLEEKSDETA